MKIDHENLAIVDEQNGRLTPLRKKEYRIFRYLFERPGVTVSGAEIMDKVFGYSAKVTSNTLNVTISAMRKKGIAIQTNYGQGFKLSDEYYGRFEI